MQKKGNAKTNAAAKAVEETAKKAATPKKNVKDTAAKGAKGKEQPVSVFTIQYDGKDAVVAKVEENIKAKFVAEGHRAGCIRNLDIYVKPEDGKAYYVVNNGKFTGNVNLF